MKLEEWLSQQDGVIEVDCGSVTMEAFYHWMRVAYEAGTLTNEGTIQAVNSPVIQDGSFSGLFSSARALLDALYEFGPDEIAISEHVANLEDALRNAAATQEVNQ